MVSHTHSMIDVILDRFLSIVSVVRGRHIIIADHITVISKTPMPPTSNDSQQRGTIIIIVIPPLDQSALRSPLGGHT